MTKQPNSALLPTTFYNSPWWLPLVNRAGNTLRLNRLPIADISEQSLLVTAQQRTGLSDFGEERFRASLRVLLDSMEQADLSLTGRVLLRKYCVRLLINRLRMQDDFKRHPEILQVPIRKPLFITGFPRTGTTLLHHLLSQDPSSRSPKLWELLSPSPPPEPRTIGNDPRIKQAAKFAKQYNIIEPNLAKVHYLSATRIEECNYLFQHDFLGDYFRVIADVPAYTEWFRTQDLMPLYRYYRQQLQLLGWHWSDKHWVLKSPSHLLGLNMLLALFPDAGIIQTHRDIHQVLPSQCSLAAITRKIYSNKVDVKRIGKDRINDLKGLSDRAMQVREKADPARIFDIYYNELVLEPVGTIRRIYDYFGYDFDPRMENNINRWLAENRQHKHGVHQYSLETFGLNPIEVDRLFASYKEKFGV